MQGFMKNLNPHYDKAIPTEEDCRRMKAEEAYYRPRLNKILGEQFLELFKMIFKGDKMQEIIKIGKKINEAIEAVQSSGLTVKELETFENYITHQETITPLLNPTFIQQHGFKLFDQAKERLGLLKPIIKLKDKGV